MLCGDIVVFQIALSVITKIENLNFALLKMTSNLLLQLAAKNTHTIDEQKHIFVRAERKYSKITFVFYIVASIERILFAHTS